jgi:hypothetical protein
LQFSVNISFHSNFAMLMCKHANNLFTLHKIFAMMAQP